MPSTRGTLDDVSPFGGWSVVGFPFPDTPARWFDAGVLPRRARDGELQAGFVGRCALCARLPVPAAPRPPCPRPPVPCLHVPCAHPPVIHTCRGPYLPCLFMRTPAGAVLTPAVRIPARAPPSMPRRFGVCLPPRRARVPARPRHLGCIPCAWHTPGPCRAVHCVAISTASTRRLRMRPRSVRFEVRGAR